MICPLEIQIYFKVKALLWGYCGMTINTHVPTFQSSCLSPSFLGFFGTEDGRSMRLRNVGNFVPINLTYIPKDLNLYNTAVITSNLARCNVLYLEWTGLMEWFVCFVRSLCARIIEDCIVRWIIRRLSAVIPILKKKKEGAFCGLYVYILHITKTVIAVCVFSNFRNLTVWFIQILVMSYKCSVFQPSW
jgi:hypothetical protein